MKDIIISYDEFMELETWYVSRISELIPTIGHKKFLHLGGLNFISKTPDCPSIDGKCECK